MGSEVHLQNSIQVPAPRQRYRGCSDFQPPPWRRGRAAEQSLSPQSVTLLSFPSHGVSVAYLHLTVCPAPLSPLGSSSPSPKLPVSRRAQADPTLMGRRWSRDAGGGFAGIPLPKAGLCLHLAGGGVGGEGEGTGFPMQMPCRTPETGLCLACRGIFRPDSKVICSADGVEPCGRGRGGSVPCWPSHLCLHPLLCRLSVTVPACSSGGCCGSGRTEKSLAFALLHRDLCA